MAFASNIFAMNTGGFCLDGASHAGADISVVDWADWLDGSPSFGVDGVTLGTAFFTPRVALQAPATSSRLHVIVERDDGWSGA